MRTLFALAAFVLVGGDSCAHSNSAGDPEQCGEVSDEIALLQTPVAPHGKSINKDVPSPSSQKPAGTDRFSLWVAAFEKNPKETLEMLNHMLQYTVTILGSKESTEPDKKHLSLISTMSEKACGGQEGPCWTKQQHEAAAKVHQPKYPFEPLLDVDFIDNAGNWLDQWMMKSHTTITTTQKAGKKAIAKLFEAPCYTHKVEHATAPAGTQCMFGVDSRDEGFHCIYDHAKHGSFGWCYTKSDKSEWGSCSESCPTKGPTRVLSQRIEGLQNKIKLLLQRMQKDRPKPAK